MLQADTSVVARAVCKSRMSAVNRLSSMDKGQVEAALKWVAGNPVVEIMESDVPPLSLSQVASFWSASDWLSWSIRAGAR